MALDARVRCACYEKGLTKPHPFPELVEYDPGYGPMLKESATEDQWEKHDRWIGRACPHEGIIDGDFLGNVWLIARTREKLQQVQREKKIRLPILLKKVIYDGTHTGDYLPVSDANKLIAEIDKLKSVRLDSHIRGILKKLRRLAKASLETGNPILF